MVMNTNTFSKTVGLTEYFRVFRDKAEKDIWAWRQMFDVGVHDNPTWQGYSVVGYGAAEERSQGALPPYHDMIEQSPTTITAVKYMLGSMIYRELLTDQRQIKDIFSRMGEALSESMSYVKDSYVARIFNRAFVYTNQYMFDSSTTALCDTHTLASGDSLTNEFPSATLTYDNFWSLVQYFTSTVVNQNNLPYTDSPKYFLYHPVQENIVEKIRRSPMEPDTTDNNKNVLDKYMSGITFIPCRLLTTNTNYFLLGSKMKQHLIFRWVKDWKPQTKVDKDFDRLGTKILTFQKFLAGVDNYIPIIGCIGA